MPRDLTRRGKSLFWPTGPNWALNACECCSVGYSHDKSLSNASIPTPYVMVLIKRVKHGRRAETRAHEYLADYRSHKEFFRTDIGTICRAFDQIGGTYVEVPKAYREGRIQEEYVDD